MGLYEVPLSVSLLGFGIGTMNKFMIVVWAYNCITALLLLYALFNHPRLLIQVARVQKAQFSYRLDGLVP